MLYCAIHELISIYLQQTDSRYILQLLKIFTLAEFSFISYYFLLLFKEELPTKKIIQVLWLSFTTYGIINIFFISNQIFDSLAMGISALIILIFCTYFIANKIKRSNSLTFYTTFHFWIVITFLIYFSGTFFLYIMLESFGRNPEYQQAYNWFIVSFITLKNVMLAVAMSKKLETKKELMPELDDDFFLILPNKY